MKIAETAAAGERERGDHRHAGPPGVERGVAERRRGLVLGERHIGGAAPLASKTTVTTRPTIATASRLPILENVVLMPEAMPAYFSGRTQRRGRDGGDEHRQPEREDRERRNPDVPDLLLPSTAMNNSAAQPRSDGPTVRSEARTLPVGKRAEARQSRIITTVVGARIRLVTKGE